MIEEKNTTNVKGTVLALQVYKDVFSKASVKILSKTMDSVSSSSFDAMSTVGLVIPCYEQVDYLSSALTSVALQSTPPTQVIVVSDEPVAKLRFAIDKSIWLSGLSDIQVIVEGRAGGASASRNAGLSQLATKWAICLDADDALHPEYIKTALLVARNEDIVVYPNFVRFGDEHGEGHMPDKFDLSELCKANFMIAPSMFPISAWESVRRKNGEGFSHALWELGGYEDQLFFIECALNGFNGRHLSEPYILYRRHLTSQTQRGLYCANISRIRTFMKDHLYRHYGFVMPMSSDAEFTHAVSRW